MRTNALAVASAIFLALTLGAAHAADTGTPGAAVGTPGAENKGNPIPVPDKATDGTAIPPKADEPIGAP